jgi:UDP-N-acetylmuramyl pentapeptide phosphotransferase/UDP-N-acetylglucosamine-1-phosphate transferase
MNIFLSNLWIPILAGFFSCIIFNLVFIYINNKYKLGQDKSYGIQKFHIKSTSRLGGLSIGISLYIVFIVIKFIDENQIHSQLYNNFFYFLICSLPVFIGGILEDITHKVLPNIRLLLASISALLLSTLLDFQINSTDVYLIDALLSIPELKILLTILVVTGFTHAINIVDGFHGLASGLILIILFGLSWLAWQEEDFLIFQLCLIHISVVLVFFVFNWPFGKIFLGDGGSYLIGFIVVELGILLVYRNKQISPMAPVVIGLIPLIETLFSIYRRIFINKISMNKPDSLHLHTLIYRRIVLKKFVTSNNLEKDKANATVSLVFFMPALVLVILTFIFYKNTTILLSIIITYLILYIYIYKNIVCFRTPIFYFK